MIKLSAEYARLDLLVICIRVVGGDKIKKLVRKEISKKALSDALSPPWVDNLNMPTNLARLSRYGASGLWT